MKCAVAIVAALAFTGAAVADETASGLKLYPTSQGQQTVGAWRAGVGEQDSQGIARQAVLLERDAADPGTSAAAQIDGVEGTPIQALVNLAYDYQAGSHCTATDPRWALFIRGKSGKRYLVNFGCKVTPASPGAEPGWIRRTATQPFIRSEIVVQLRRFGSKIVTDALAGTVDSLALVVDRSVGSVLVDNIAVAAKPRSGFWTYAGDNGAGTPQGPPVFDDEQIAMLAASVTAEELMTADEVNASLTDEERSWIQDETYPTG